MLTILKISNYAIINEAEITFSPQLNIITGETGAGKSILLGALGLILGERADAKFLFNKEKKCFVEGVFDIRNYDLKHFFIEENIDYENETIIRREVSDNGKSRAFINDIPVTLIQLQKLTAQLITIHSQHETLNLADSAFQLMVIDALANNAALLNKYTVQYKLWKSCSKKLADVETEIKQAAAEKDFLEFQFAELDKIELHTINQQQLEDELMQLTHAEEIIKSLSACVNILSSAENNIADLLRTSIAHLKSIATYSSDIQPYIERLESVYIELTDITDDIEHKADGTVAGGSRTDEIQHILNNVYHLQKKHALTTVDALIEFKNALQQKLSLLSNATDEIEKLKEEKHALFLGLLSYAKQLSDSRKKIFPSLEKQVKNLLGEVGMKDAELKIQHLFNEDHLSETAGGDTIQYLFSANKGSLPQDIKKVASGGELSRLMLCIKSLIAKSTALPTLLFDEIDTGVSGEIANKVGNILTELASKHQVIAITHLPQIAAKGNHHLYVFKTAEKNTTYTQIKLLALPDRQIEIAKMLSGDIPTKAALENAKELLVAQK